MSYVLAVKKGGKGKWRWQVRKPASQKVLAIANIHDAHDTPKEAEASFRRFVTELCGSGWLSDWCSGRILGRMQVVTEEGE